MAPRAVYKSSLYPQPPSNFFWKPHLVPHKFQHEDFLCVPFATTPLITKYFICHRIYPSQRLPDYMEQRHNRLQLRDRLVCFSSKAPISDFIPVLTLPSQLCRWLNLKRQSTATQLQSLLNLHVGTYPLGKDHSILHFSSGVTVTTNINFDGEDVTLYT
jgi:hypothetical protein